MMSYREMLLNQTEPLEPDEVATLKNWLEALEEDCEVFGPTGGDGDRMERIRARITREESAG